MGFDQLLSRSLGLGEVAEGKRKKGEEDEEDEGDEVWQEGKRLEDFLLQTVISFDFNYCK